MSDKSVVSDSDSLKTTKSASWGSILFVATLIIVLVFFWWLLIDSGGVSGHHG